METMEQIEQIFSKEIARMRELSRESTRDIVMFTKHCLSMAGLGFWTSPASKTGVNHPLTSNGYGGNIVHTKSTFWIADTICKTVYDENDETERLDYACVLSACLLHDLDKFIDSLETHGGHAADRINMEIERIDKGNIYFRLISFGVRHHMGKFGNTDYSTWLRDVMPRSRFEHVARAVHLADYLSSRRFLEFNHDFT